MGVQQSCDPGDNADCNVAVLKCPSGICQFVNDEPCVVNDDCIGTCLSGFCADLSGFQGPCDTGDSEDCQDVNFQCSLNTCLKVDGVPCSGNTDCINVCIQGICGLPSGPGQPCDAGEDSDCNSINLECDDLNTCTLVCDIVDYLF